jgi:hypothetical protein
MQMSLGGSTAGHPLRHLTTSRRPTNEERPYSGIIDHVPLGSRGFEAMKQNLTDQGVPIT